MNPIAVFFIVFLLSIYVAPELGYVVNPGGPGWGNETVFAVSFAFAFASAFGEFLWELDLWKKRRLRKDPV